MLADELSAPPIRCFLARTCRSTGGSLQGDLLTELATLRLKSLIGPHYPGGEGALAFHAKMIGTAQHRGELRRWRDRAFVAVWEQERPPHTVHLMVHRAPDDPVALQWCLKTLDAWVPCLDERLEVVLPVGEVALREHLLGQGLGINGVNLAGRVDVALQRLIERYSPPQSSPGLHIRPIQTTDADGVIELRARCFGAEPIYHWFGSDPVCQSAARAVIEDGGADRSGWVVEREGEIVGMFELQIYSPCPHHGSSAGIGLIFDESVRGRGLGKLAYRRILEHLSREGIGWFKGVTGRQPVLHLSTVMGRGLTGVVLRRNWVFEPGWFDAVL